MVTGFVTGSGMQPHKHIINTSWFDAFVATNRRKFFCLWVYMFGPFVPSSPSIQTRCFGWNVFPMKLQSYLNTDGVLTCLRGIYKPDVDVTNAKIKCLDQTLDFDMNT
jgi:hypothetical protein